MDGNIFRIDKCENCGHKVSVTVREVGVLCSVNGDLTDKDIRYIVANHEKQRYEYCSNCELTGLITTVAWQGLTQTNSEVG